jgi:uncharacterized membrane protein YfcA
LQVEFDIQTIFLLGALCAAGAVAGITSGLFGNGGGFVVVPALLAVFPLFTDQQDSLVYVAIGTSLATIVVSSARSVQAHHARGAVDFEVLRDWSIWLLIGVLIGLVIAAMSDASGLVRLFAIGVLIYSLYFLFPGALAHLSRQLAMPTGAARAGLASFLGGFSALLGIGGGTITVMTMVICNRPVHQAVATASGVGFIIGLPGAIGFMMMGLGRDDLPMGSVGYINIPALLAICAVSVVTAPIGAGWAHRLDETRLKRLFGVYLVIVSFSMFYKSTHL